LALLKNVDIKNDSMIALSPKMKKYANTSVLSLYLNILSMVQAVMTAEEIANCKDQIMKK
jgi:uncharacterized membrane protein